MAMISVAAMLEVGGMLAVSSLKGQVFFWVVGGDQNGAWMERKVSIGTIARFDTTNCVEMARMETFRGYFESTGNFKIGLQLTV